MWPETMAEYDYDQKFYSRELWPAEGLSSYYDNLLLFRLLLFRAGLITVPEKFELLLKPEISKHYKACMEK